MPIDGPTTLAEQNEHSRDSALQYNEAFHQYKVRGIDYMPVTKFSKFGFSDFNAAAAIASMRRGKNWNETHPMWGKTDAEIQAEWKQSGAEASAAGTLMHANIETFMNHDGLAKGYSHQQLLEDYLLDERDYDDHHHGTPEENPEWHLFMKYVEDRPAFVPYRTEWRVYDEDARVAGTIDMVYLNKDGSLAIYDWKRAKEFRRETRWSKYNSSEGLTHIVDENFWHYTMQLNIYRYILQRNYGFQVNQLALVRLHPNISEPDVVEVPLLDNEMEFIFARRRNAVKGVVTKPSAAASASVADDEKQKKMTDFWKSK